MAKLNLKRWGGAFALFAYCLQLLVSFGHIHADEIYGPIGHAIEIGAGADRIAAPPLDRHGTQDQADTSDACAICAAIHLASSGLLPDAVRLPVPAVAGGRMRRVSQPLVLTPRFYLLSHTRAPPAFSI